MTRLDFIGKYGPMLSEVCKGTGLFASVALAQAILETATKQPDGSYAPGTSKLYAGHNFFGIKAQENDGWVGKRVLVQTWEVVHDKRVNIKDYFRVYATEQEGLADRLNFLTDNHRYTRAGVFLAKTAEQQAQALLAGGWATDPDYPKKLMSMVNKYDLYRFDIETFPIH